VAGREVRDCLHFILGRTSRHADDPHPFAGQRDGGGPAYAGARTGDDGNLSREVEIHGHQPSDGRPLAEGNLVGHLATLEAVPAANA
jgi:hypothetical protein